MQLTGELRRVVELRPPEQARMYCLLTKHYVNVTPAQFGSDLAEKEWAILLRDSAGTIQGFSTLMRLRIAVAGEPVVAFFSGDTIIAPAHWGQSTLARLWAQHVFGLAATIHDASVYWFLISAGYKTYRFLSVFFRVFYPTCARPTPPHIQHILDTLAFHKFPTEYDPTSGIVRLRATTPLRAGIADVTPQRLHDPHVAFFVAANPGYAQGDELACIAEISPHNLTAAGRRMVQL
jgi:hypothetical protein